jgi:hypothetical protein
VNPVKPDNALTAEGGILLETVYIALEEEGTNCWRPVQAERLSSTEFVLRGPVPEDEVWHFQPGDRVRCTIRISPDGSPFLVAVEKV